MLDEGSGSRGSTRRTRRWTNDDVEGARLAVGGEASWLYREEGKEEKEKAKSLDWERRRMSTMGSPTGDGCRQWRWWSGGEGFFFFCIFCFCKFAFFFLAAWILVGVNGKREIFFKNLYLYLRRRRSKGRKKKHNMNYED